MKKTILSFFIAIVALASCSNNSNKAETCDAQHVKCSATENSFVYDSLKANGKIAWSCSDLSGRVQFKSAEMLVSKDSIKKASFVIDIEQISVENFGDDKEKTNATVAKLLSKDFLNAKSHPTATFVLTSIKHVEGPFNSEITGDLTILGITKNISFVANVSINDVIIGITSETFKLNKTDWGLSKNANDNVESSNPNELSITLDFAVFR